MQIITPVDVVEATPCKTYSPLYASDVAKNALITQILTLPELQGADSVTIDIREALGRLVKYGN